MKKRTRYKPLRLLLCLGLLSLLWTCKSNSIAKNEAKANDLAVLETLLNQQDYYISIDVIEPFNTAATTQVVNALMLRNTGNNANRIDVRGDGNFIEIQNDSAKAYLPFFGERQLGGGNYASNNVGIRFEDTPKDFTYQTH